MKRLLAKTMASLGLVVAAVAGEPTSLARADTRAGTDTTNGLSAFTQGEYAEAIQDWRHAADHGDANGALYVGTMYDAGFGVHENYAAALQWYQRAAELGSAAGAFNVGVMYDAGKSVIANPAQAAVWYGKAAKLGYARADYNLALLYQGGVGVKRDTGRAAKLFRAAARLGLGAARTHLAALGYNFTGPAAVPVDTAAKEFDDAQSALLGRSPEGAARAVQLFRAAADHGNAMAQYDLGYCYDSGIGTPVNKLQAYIWYRRAAAQTHDQQLKIIARSGVASLENLFSPLELQQATATIAAAAPISARSSHLAVPGK